MSKTKVEKENDESRKTTTIRCKNVKKKNMSKKDKWTLIIAFLVFLTALVVPQISLAQGKPNENYNNAMKIVKQAYKKMKKSGGNDEKTLLLFEQAIDGYKKSIQSKEQLAQFSCFHLGEIYTYGPKTLRNDVEALNYYRKGAEMGYYFCQYKAGEMYEKGIGTERDLREAEKWYLKIMESGNYSAHATELYNKGMNSLKKTKNSNSENFDEIIIIGDSKYLAWTNIERNENFILSRASKVGMPACRQAAGR